MLEVQGVRLVRLPLPVFVMARGSAAAAASVERLSAPKRDGEMGRPTGRCSRHSSQQGQQGGAREQTRRQPRSAVEVAGGAMSTGAAAPASVPVSAPPPTSAASSSGVRSMVFSSFTSMPMPPSSTVSALELPKMPEGTREGRGVVGVKGRGRGLQQRRRCLRTAPLSRAHRQWPGWGRWPCGPPQRCRGRGGRVGGWHRGRRRAVGSRVGPAWTPGHSSTAMPLPHAPNLTVRCS